MNSADTPPQIYTKGVWPLVPQSPGLYGMGRDGNATPFSFFGMGRDGNVTPFSFFGMGRDGNAQSFSFFGMPRDGNATPFPGMGRDGNVTGFYGASLRLPDFYSTGYIPDCSDHRDSVYESSSKSQLPRSVDLSRGGRFGPVDDQGPVQCCAAHAVTSLVEYGMNEHGKKPGRQLSRLFNYKVARGILGVSGDVGATVRDSIKGLRRYGCPLEEAWPYEISYLEREPVVHDFEVAKKFRHSWEYHRLDHPGVRKTDLLGRLKRALADGVPAAFGVSLPAAATSVKGRSAAATIPVFEKDEPVAGRHCLVAVGYDDGKKALRVRNSWGKKWGDKGYAWLPYDYVLRYWAMDFWTLQRKKAA